ncbi:hypothetical protein OAO65_02235 [Flavobacteriales bacterium]|nr:hypothetical protein [Flavobacteriales bacterium]
MFWKIAGASEPATYSWTLNGNDSHQSIVKVFSSATDAVVDAAAAGAKYTTFSSPVVVNAIDGEVISNNAVSLVFGGKDRNNATTRTYTGADNSYVSPLGSTDGRMTAGAHRIYTTGTTFSGNVTITPDNTTTSDVTYNIHISFVEGGGGPVANPKGPLGHPFFGPFRGPIS